MFNPVGGPADDNPAAAVGQPVRHLLAFPPQPPVAPLALEPADVAAVGHDFAPDSFVRGIVRTGASLVSREGDFGFSKENGTPPEGHDIQLVNFSKPGEPLKLELTRFAFNCPEADQIRIPGRAPQCVSIADQAFVSQIRGINRPVTARFGPDGALYLVDYGAVRDFGQGDPDSRFTNPADAPLVVIPHTGVIWRITEGRPARGARAPRAARPVTGLRLRGGLALQLVDRGVALAEIRRHRHVAVRASSGGGPGAPDERGVER